MMKALKKMMVILMTLLIVVSIGTACKRKDEDKAEDTVVEETNDTEEKGATDDQSVEDQTDPDDKDEVGKGDTEDEASSDENEDADLRDGDPVEVVAGYDLFRRSEVTLSEGIVFIEAEPEMFSDAIVPSIQDLFADLYENVPTMTVVLDLYDGIEPIFQVLAEEEALMAYAESGDRDAFMEAMSVVDTRTPERRISESLASYNTIVYQVAVDEDLATIALAYYGEEDEIGSDFIDMNWEVVEDAPWIDDIHWIFETDEGVFSQYIVSSEAVLGVISQKMTPDQFAQRIEVIEE